MISKRLCVDDMKLSSEQMADRVEALMIEAGVKLQPWEKAQIRQIYAERAAKLGTSNKSE